MRALVFTSILLLAGCADPKYVSETPAPDVNPKAGAFANCTYKFETAGVCLGYTWEQLASEGTPATLIARFYKPDDLDGFPMIADPPGELTVKIRMPGMGHGAPPVKVQKLAPGTFRVSNMYFSIMAGDWEIRFDFANPGGVSDAVLVPYVF